MWALETVIARAGVVIVVDGLRDVLSWCDEMCSDEWHYETSQLGHQTSDIDSLMTYVFFFRSRVDARVFQRTFKEEIALAGQLVNAIE